MKDYTSSVFVFIMWKYRRKKKNQERNGLYSLKHHPRSTSQDETRKS